jgi:phosphopentomutase
MKKFKRIFVIVTDSMGIGEMPDSAKYHDEGANTFGHIAEKSDHLITPTLEKIGIGNICANSKVPAVEKPMGLVMRMREASVGKDTLTGHFEMMGLKVTKPFPSFTETGFPKDLIDKIEAYSHRKVIGNCSASGTEILKQLGEEQCRDDSLIVYTSADSVLQIAANEDVIPLKELYDICSYVRKITIDNPNWMVGRIIARPYVGTTKENFKRTTNRHDYALAPFDKTVLDFLVEKEIHTIGVGKIHDIFDGQGIEEFYRTTSNHNGMEITTSLLDKSFEGFVFTNLVDFDALYGHRRDVLGYRNAIEEFDQDLANFISKMQEDDLVMIASDHGNDPIHAGTDHTREYVPLMIYHKNIKGGVLEDRDTFATIGATIADNFSCQMPTIGKSILKEVVK